MKPEKGKHPVYCACCGKQYTTVEHFGGKKKIKYCKYCFTGSRFNLCLKCFSKIYEQKTKKLS
jgi:hypothetical protein